MSQVEPGQARMGAGFVSEDAGFSYGAHQWFRTPSGYTTAVYWFPRTGTYAINGRGAIYWRWGQNTQVYGFPTHDERWEADGRVHLRLSSGAHFTWSEREGTRRLR
ncbi:MAG: hypothetical protein Q4A03_08610 [Rothia sp. (in: high G+C Gram-positive bacteria)]|nr:hypothetical protein [Rothia sp. (in: high G+C Gram-positive bacteria)]